MAQAGSRPVYSTGGLQQVLEAGVGGRQQVSSWAMGANGE